MFKSIKSKQYLREGEDWAEKIACELAELLDLPHAKYELATYHGKGGISYNFISDNNGEYLILGNELLQPFFCGVVYGNPNLQYIEDVYKIMTETTQYVPLGFNYAEIKIVSEVFLGYLMY